MLSNPDISPSASINWWIVAILTFHFDLIHVPGTHHGPDGLSRQPWQDRDNEDKDDKEDFTDWIDQLHGFLHQINVVGIRPPTTSDSLPFPFPCISTLTQAADLSEEDTPMLDTTDTDIDDSPSPLGQCKQKSTTLAFSKSSSGYKILDDQTASLRQSMQLSCDIVQISL
jgi:hypothetical protein